VKRAFLDSNVFTYATGTEHPYRDPCRAVLAALADGALIGETSVEVVQEAAHVRVRRSGRRADARELADRIQRACTVHAFEPADLARALEIFVADESLPMRDAVHAAVALGRGVATLVSADRDFDRVPGVSRVDPLDRDSLQELLAAPR
jgi:predicted nucleic acid-binding protein